MEEKPRIIRTVGLVVTIFAGCVVFTNAIGALAFSFILSGEEISPTVSFSENPMAYVFAHYLELCLIMIAIGILYLIGGLNIRKYKAWAGKLVTVISALLIVFIWGLMIMMAYSATGFNTIDIFSLGTILIAVVWSAPFALLIWFLNREKSKRNFI